MGVCALLGSPSACKAKYRQVLQHARISASHYIHPCLKDTRRLCSTLQVQGYIPHCLLESAKYQCDMACDCQRHWLCAQICGGSHVQLMNPNSRCSKYTVAALSHCMTLARISHTPAFQGAVVSPGLSLNDTGGLAALPLPALCQGLAVLAQELIHFWVYRAQQGCFAKGPRQDILDVRLRQRLMLQQHLRQPVQVLLLLRLQAESSCASTRHSLHA